MTQPDSSGPNPHGPDSLPNGLPNGLDDVDKPLDPAAQRLQQKMRRLVLISSLTMLLGLAAVFVAIIYRVNKIDDNDPQDFVASLSLPAGHEVRSATLSDGKIILLLRSNGADTLNIFDAQSGRALGVVALNR